jgi:hypothetical protein
VLCFQSILLVKILRFEEGRGVGQRRVIFQLPEGNKIDVKDLRSVSIQIIIKKKKTNSYLFTN